MYEKVSPCHIDKIADRIAGAMVDLAYAKQENPKVAVEVLIGHRECNIIAESSYEFGTTEVADIVERIAGKQFTMKLRVVPQDKYLAENQKMAIRCGDNGIFKAVKTSEEERILSQFAKYLYKRIIKSDGKYLIDKDHITICQSGINNDDLIEVVEEYFRDYDYMFTINPLGDWNDDLNNDTGVTGRKLGSDLGRGATGGAICGKDLTKSDVSVNILLNLILNKPNTLRIICPLDDRDTLNDVLKAAENKDTIECTCSIGDNSVNICGVYVPFDKIVSIVKHYITICVGGFEKLAEWGLI